MLKFLFRIIGIIAVLMMLMTAVLFFLDSQDFLHGNLGQLIGSLRHLSQEAWTAIRLFVSDTHLADDAAGLLDQGAQFFRDSVEPHPTDRPGAHPYSPSPVPLVTPLP